MSLEPPASRRPPRPPKPARLVTTTETVTLTSTSVTRRPVGHPYPSQLFENLGGGKYRDVAAASGVENLRYSKGTVWGDYDNDGDLDLFVSNFGENRLYRNDGPPAQGGTGWRFTDVAPELGLIEPVRESFATWFFDVENDGDLDLFVGDYRAQGAQVTASYFGVPAPVGQPLLYLNTGKEGKERFVEVSRERGIARPAMPMGANFGDLDNDGWLDVYLGTGEPDLASVMPNQMYRNQVRPVRRDFLFWRGFAHLQKGHGVAFGDVDNDGDQDLFHQLGGFYPADSFGNALFENPGNGNRWVTLRFVVQGGNTHAVGARVKLTVRSETGATRNLYRVVGIGGSFGSSSHQLEVGLGAASGSVRIEVDWPGKRRTGAAEVLVSRDAFEGVELDRVYRIIKTSGAPARIEPLEVTPIALGAPGVRPHHGGR